MSGIEYVSMNEIELIQIGPEKDRERHHTSTISLQKAAIAFLDHFLSFSKIFQLFFASALVVEPIASAGARRH